jgi:hypothetical protein
VAQANEGAEVKTTEMRVITAAKAWAQAERKLRDYSWNHRNSAANPPSSIGADSEITEQTLLVAVEELEKDESGAVLTFFGQRLREGDPIPATLFEWLKSQAVSQSDRWPR